MMNRKDEDYKYPTGDNFSLRTGEELRAEEDAALAQVTDVALRNNATAEELGRVIKMLGLAEALDRLRKDVKMDGV